GFGAFAAAVFGRRKVMVLAALLTTFAGVALLVDRPKGSILEWVAPPLVAIGGTIFVWQVWPQIPRKESAQNHIFDKILSRLGFDKRSVSLFPALGVGIVLSDIASNVILYANPQILTVDCLFILLGAKIIIL